MKLLEYEGKALLSGHGVPVPAGALWPQVPDSGNGWIIKAQVLAGGRGKRGGIQAADTRSQLEQRARAMQASRLGDELVHAVYIEPRLRIAHEYYLAAIVNRDQGQVSVMASASGGINIEQVPKSRIATIDLDPLAGLMEFQVQHLRRALGLQDSLGAQFGDIVRNTVVTLVQEDAELVEINPLVCTAEGQLVAADAKVALDDDAMFRHPNRPGPAAWSADSRFMQRCRELGVIGVDSRTNGPPPKRPSVALLGNGAGLTMATYDQIALSGVGVAGAIELHGALARGVDHTAEVIRTLFLLEADVVFINAFYQLRSTHALAQALLQSLDSPGAPSRDSVVVRMRGVQQETSQRMMEEGGCFYTPSLDAATARVLAVVDAMSHKAGMAR
jgi:succinyl-CoA synthetase beta subunit